MYDNTIILYDENGEEVEFELVDSLEVDGRNYVIVAPVDEDTDEAIILRVDKDENGEDILVTVDDEDEYNAVVDAYNDLVLEYDDEYDEEYEDDFEEDK